MKEQTYCECKFDVFGNFLHQHLLIPLENKIKKDKNIDFKGLLQKHIQKNFPNFLPEYQVND